MEPVFDLAQVQGWAREAGEIALGYWQNVSATLKADRTLVTRADREVEELLAARIRSAFPDHALIAEEGARASGVEYLWAVDPIDGTRAFVQGLPGWGIAIGLLHRGQPRWGVFYMPALGDWTYTVGSEGAEWNGRDLQGRLRAELDEQSFVAVSSSTHYRYEFDFPWTRALGSVEANIAYTARGSALGAFIRKAAIWDLAAGAAVLLRLGAELRYLSGAPVRWEELLNGRYTTEPILAAHPALVDRLRGMIRARPR
jgi:myo-inositol-1(or 4)-monophosphatase